MSAGQFIDTLYQADSGLVFPTRLQPETELAQLNGTVNDAPAGPVTPGAPYLRVRVGKRSRGLQPRYVIVKMTANPAGQYADYQGLGTSHKIVVGNPAVFSGLSKGQEATYLGTACIITRVVGEVG
jgi:hypothetical protein